MKPNQTCQWAKQWPPVSVRGLSVDIGADDQQKRTVPHLKLSDIRSFACTGKCTSLIGPLCRCSVCIWHRMLAGDVLLLLMPVDAIPVPQSFCCFLPAPTRLNHRLNEYYFSSIIFWLHLLASSKLFPMKIICSKSGDLHWQKRLLQAFFCF